MLEIILLLLLSRRIAQERRKRGYDPAPGRYQLVGAWLGAELLGFAVGYAAFGDYPELRLPLYLLALLCGGAGGALVYGRTLRLAPRAGESAGVEYPTGAGTRRPIGRRTLVAAAGLAGVVVAAGSAYFLLVPRTGGVVVLVSDSNGDTVAAVDVCIDGQLLCHAIPCRVEDLDQGAHTLDLESEGYDPPAPRAFVVEAGKQVTVDVRLRGDGPMPEPGIQRRDEPAAEAELPDPEELERRDELERAKVQKMLEQARAERKKRSSSLGTKPGCDCPPDDANCVCY